MDDADASAHRFAAAFKAVVAQGASLAGGLSLQSASTARDGTHKLVFAVHGGPGGNVETVLIPMHNRCGLAACLTGVRLFQGFAALMSVCAAHTAAMMLCSCQP